MGENSKIEWTDATWNPVTGCSVVSPGCTNCYAMRLAGTRMKHHPSRAGLTVSSKAGPVWNGEVRLNLEWIDEPLRWKRPRRIFACAHGDLFHENVPDDWIDRVFAVMALAPQHTFQVLTKRADRMRAYVNSDRAWANLEHEICRAVTKYGVRTRLFQTVEHPLPNVHLGVSAEDQRRADERIPDLLATPAAVRFASVEPLLGPVDLTPWLARRYESYICGWNQGQPAYTVGALKPRLDWVIVGGESGPGARVWDGFYDAARSLRDQCRAASVAFYMKQTQGVAKRSMPPIPDDLMIREFPHT